MEHDSPRAKSTLSDSQSEEDLFRLDPVMTSMQLARFFWQNRFLIIIAGLLSIPLSRQHAAHHYSNQFALTYDVNSYEKRLNAEKEFYDFLRGELPFMEQLKAGLSHTLKDEVISLTSRYLPTSNVVLFDVVSQNPITDHELVDKYLFEFIDKKLATIDAERQLPRVNELARPRGLESALEVQARAIGERYDRLLKEFSKASNAEELAMDYRSQALLCVDHMLRIVGYLYGDGLIDQQRLSEEVSSLMVMKKNYEQLMRYKAPDEVPPVEKIKPLDAKFAAGLVHNRSYEVLLGSIALPLSMRVVTGLMLGVLMSALYRVIRYFLVSRKDFAKV